MIHKFYYNIESNEIVHTPPVPKPTPKPPPRAIITTAPRRIPQPINLITNFPKLPPRPIPEPKEPEPEAKEPEPEVKEQEQEPEVKEPEPEVKEPEVKEPEVKEPELEEPIPAPRAIVTTAPRRIPQPINLITNFPKLPPRPTPEPKEPKPEPKPEEPVPNIPTPIRVTRRTLGPIFRKRAMSSNRRSTFISDTISAPVLNSESLPTPFVYIYILCHNEARFANASEIFKPYYWAKPILMKYQDCTFENAVWKQLLEIKDEWIGCEMIGTMSSIAHTKINLSTVDHMVRNRTLWNNGYSNFTGPTPLKNDHPHLLTIMTDICKKIGIAMPTTVSLYNYWMCTPSLMVAFIEWFETTLKPAVLAHLLSMTDAQYASNVLKYNDLKQLCGVPYYPHAPFVIERLNRVFFDITTNFSYSSQVYMIGGVDGGGSLKFINEFIQTFPHTKRIIHKNDLLNRSFNINDIFVVQHLFNDITPAMITSIYNKYKLRIIINIHDFIWFGTGGPHNGYVAPNICIVPDVKELFSNAELIIHPSRFTFNEYTKYVPSTNFIISPHIDYSVIDSPLFIPSVIDTINIGYMHEFSECKGGEYILYLQNKFNKYKTTNIKFLVAGKNIPIYKENEFFEVIKKYNIHCLFLLNKWGETYCYSLSKYLKSGLPILYNAIGAVVERIPNRSHYKQVFDEVVQFDATNKLYLETKFAEMLDFIIENTTTNSAAPTITDLTLSIPPLYDHLFNLSIHKNIVELIHHKIKPFCIYFPQFHTLEENDYNYYPGMTDMTNLIAYCKAKGNDSMDSPDINALGISGLDQYNLTNKAIITKQVNIAKNYGIYGFSVYYYWFSNNSITDRHTIMEQCYNNFFEETLDDFKVYFNWANEDWTKNPAFISKDSVNISNTYSREMIIANFNNLKRYFLHPNYYKIDNAPVFGIHHPFLMSESELQLVETIFTEECKTLGFSSIHIIKNSMVKQYDKSFLMAPNYKIPRTSNDYITYIPKDVRSDTIHTVFFSFNNTVRMYKPSKSNIVKITNTSPSLMLQHLKFIIASYKNSPRTELNKILLINSWNEWGEDMAIEPSYKKGFFYLDIIKQCLMTILP